MPKVTIDCETDASQFDLSVFTPKGKLLFACPPNTPFEKDLKAGDYIVAWRVFGESNTKYKITFDGVSDPTKPVERKIHDGELLAAAHRGFSV